MSRRDKIISCILWCASAFWIAVIFINSMQTGNESGAMSGSVTDAINAFLGSIHDSLHVSHRFVRKAAHFTEFALLATLLCFAVRSLTRQNDQNKHNLLWVFAAFFGALVTAAIDETIQIFTDGRVGSVIDVLIDSSGAACATLVFFLILVVFKRKRTEI